MVFFDIKPIAVKAYGGRRYTSAKRLVLERYQKTRGFFYLFALYDVKHGCVRWAFYPRKDAEHVCRFLRRVRHVVSHSGGVGDFRSYSSLQVARNASGDVRTAVALD